MIALLRRKQEATPQEWAELAGKMDLRHLAANDHRALAFILTSDTRFPAEFRREVIQAIKAMDPKQFKPDERDNLHRAVLDQIKEFADHPDFLKRVMQSARENASYALYDFASGSMGGLSSVFELKPEAAKALIDETFRQFRGMTAKEPSHSQTEIDFKAIDKLDGLSRYKYKDPDRNPVPDHIKQIGNAFFDNINIPVLTGLPSERSLYLLSQFSNDRTIQERVLKDVAAKSPALFMQNIAHVRKMLGDEAAANMAKEILQRPIEMRTPERQEAAAKLHQAAYEGYYALRERYDAKPIITNTIEQHIKFDALSYQFLENKTRYTQEGGELNNKLMNYVADNQPRLLTSIAGWGSMQQEPRAGYVRRALEGMGYDIPALERTTGIPLKDMPLGYFAPAASEKTVAPAVWRAPTRVFNENIKGFAATPKTPAATTSGYVLTIEHDSPNGDYSHILATNNIIRSAAHAMGAPNIAPLSLVAHQSPDNLTRVEQEAKAHDDKALAKLIHNASVIQTSTSTRGNRTANDYNQAIKHANPHVIHVASAGNDMRLGIDKDPQKTINIQDPSGTRHLSFIHMVEFGASVNGVVQDYSQADAQSLVTAPMFKPSFPFHHPQTGPYRGEYNSGTSFASPMGAAILAKAKADYPNLKPHHLLYAMAQTAESITKVEGTDKKLLYTAPPHGMVFSHIGGAGELQRDRMYKMLDRMNELAVTNPALVGEAQRDKTIDFNAPRGVTSAIGTTYTLPVSGINRTLERPIFEIHYPDEIVQKARGWHGEVKITITAPNGATQDYMVDTAKSGGKAYISGVGFFGAQADGDWKITVKAGSTELPVSSVKFHSISVPKDDLINLREFRKEYGLNLKGQDVSHLRDIFIQPDTATGFKGGWLSAASREGWLKQVDLTGTKLSQPLLETLPKDHPLRRAAPPAQGVPSKGKGKRASLEDGALTLAMANGLLQTNAEPAAMIAPAGSPAILERALQFAQTHGTPTDESVAVAAANEAAREANAKHTPDKRKPDQETPAIA